MKHVKTILVLTTLAALLAMPAMAVQLGQESFETTTGYTVTPDFAQGATSTDYFLRVDATGTLPSGFSVALGSIDGDWFIGGEDTNGSTPLPSNGIHTMAIDAVSITGYNNLTVTVALNGKNAAKYDTRALSNGDYLEVFASIDGGADVLIGRFTKVGASGSGGYLGEDTDLDGLGDVEITDYANFQDYTFNVTGTGDDLVVKVVTRFESGDEEIAYDNVRVNGDLGGPTNEYDAHVVIGGVGAQATISSLVDTQPEAQIVHTCEIYDAGDGGMAQNTIIDGLTFVQGNANDISWSNIAGAELFDGTTTYVGSVGSSSIGFTFVPALVLLDGGPMVTLELAVWLTTSLIYNADHAILEFELGPSNFAVNPTGAFFAMGDPPVESGDLNNEIDIVAIGIGITTQPPSLVGVNESFYIRAGFVDENNGIDEDFPPENMTVSVNTGIGGLSSSSGLTIMSSNGQSAFYNLLYDALDTGVTLKVISGTYPGPAVTDPFDTYYSPTITCDVAPLCWDGDATADAIPFAVHITVENWTDAAGQDAYLKVYEGSNNPYHYTEEFGWTISYYYDHKPVVSIDANGNYSGWLFLKSGGFNQFRPRIALVSDTDERLTGVDVYGTALDLTTEGGVLMDSDGSTYSTGGNAILAYNESDDLIGTTLAEDNGYPTDNGGYTIAAHGFIMAVCEVCDEDVTYESWNPAYYPGNGMPDKTDTDYTCVEGGSVAEVGIDVILPVELSSFTATASDASIMLNWATASESNVSHFDLLRNTELVYTVEAGNTANGSEYTWTDSDVDNGTTYSYSLMIVDMDGNSSELSTVEATPSFNGATVTEYALHQNFPNPFNPETSIAFDMVDAGFVTLSVYNVLGQEVASLVNGTMDAGRHIVSFNAANLTSGLYLYRIEANGFTAQMKMVLMK